MNKIDFKVNQYRKEICQKGGVVVLFAGKISGWMNELRSPENWEPGCIAINSDGKKFEATGGNYYNGATYWKPLAPG